MLPEQNSHYPTVAPFIQHVCYEFHLLNEYDGITIDGAYDHAAGVQESLYCSTMIAWAASAFGCLFQVCIHRVHDEEYLIVEYSTL